MRFDVSNRTSSELQKETISAFEFCILNKINSDAMFSSYSFSCASIFVCFSENHLKYFTLSNYQKFPLCWAFCLTCKRVGASSNIHLNAGAFRPTPRSINGDCDSDIHVEKKISIGFGDSVTSLVVACALVVTGTDGCTVLLCEHKKWSTSTTNSVITRCCSF